MNCNQDLGEPVSEHRLWQLAEVEFDHVSYVVGGPLLEVNTC